MTIGEYDRVEMLFPPYIDPSQGIEPPQGEHPSIPCLGSGRASVFRNVLNRGIELKERICFMFGEIALNMLFRNPMRYKWPIWKRIIRQCHCNGRDVSPTLWCQLFALP